MVFVTIESMTHDTQYITSIENWDYSSYWPMQWGNIFFCTFLNGLLLYILFSQAFQREIHEKLAQLEMINSHYRRLARENRTDSANRLRTMVHQGNQRWDSLHKRVAAILRRLRVSPAHGITFYNWLLLLMLMLHTNTDHYINKPFSTFHKFPFPFLILKCLDVQGY